MCLVVTIIALLLLRRRATGDPAALIVVVALLLWRAAVTTVALVTGIAEGVSAHGSERTANGSALQTTTALIADDAADSSTCQSSKNRSCLCIRT